MARNEALQEECSAEALGVGKKLTHPFLKKRMHIKISHHLTAIGKPV
jgi:hypothetical protein